MRVVVLGLWPEQEGRVKRRSGLHLTFADRDKWQRRLIPACDLCVLMARFISHRHFEQAKRDLPRERIVVCHSSVSALNTLLAGTAVAS